MSSPKSRYWIVVANASKLKIFACNHDLHKIGTELAFVQELNHDISRLKKHNLDDDRPGRYKVDISGDGSAYEQKRDAKEAEKVHFAKEIDALLKQAKTADKYINLIIIAPDHFYGILKAHFDHVVQDSIYLTILKDYSSFSTEDLAKSILDEIVK